MTSSLKISTVKITFLVMFLRIQVFRKNFFCIRFICWCQISTTVLFCFLFNSFTFLENLRVRWFLRESYYYLYTYIVILILRKWVWFIFGIRLTSRLGIILGACWNLSRAYFLIRSHFHGNVILMLSYIQWS